VAMSGTLVHDARTPMGAAVMMSRVVAIMRCHMGAMPLDLVAGAMWMALPVAVSTALMFVAQVAVAVVRLVGAVVRPCSAVTRTAGVLCMRAVRPANVDPAVMRRPLRHRREWRRCIGSKPAIRRWRGRCRRLACLRSGRRLVR
jgi:hypothetical protein